MAGGVRDEVIVQGATAFGGAFMGAGIAELGAGWGTAALVVGFLLAVLALGYPMGVRWAHRPQAPETRAGAALPEPHTS